MLLIRRPISSTKKFFKNTVHSFKSFFSSPSYQKLPKTTTTTMDFQKTLNPKRVITPSSSPPPSTKNNITVISSSSSSSSTLAQAQAQDHQGKLVEYIKDTKKRSKDPNQDGMRCEERRCFVAQKLRELEMVDMGNIDHKLDIEEVLYYYSRLTSPPYLQLVDAFFMEIYADFFDPSLFLNSKRLR